MQNAPYLEILEKRKAIYGKTLHVYLMLSAVLALCMFMSIIDGRTFFILVIVVMVSTLLLEYFTKPRSYKYLLLEVNRIVIVTKTTREQEILDGLSSIVINYDDYEGQPRNPGGGRPSGGMDNYITIHQNGKSHTYNVIIRRSTLFPLNAIISEWRLAGIDVKVLDNSSREVAKIF